MVRRGLEPSGFRGSQKCINTAGISEGEAAILGNEPSEGEAAASGAVAAGDAGAGAGGHHHPHAHPPTDENTTEDDEQQTEEFDAELGGAAAADEGEGAAAVAGELGGELLNELDNGDPSPSHHAALNALNGGSFGREVKTHMDENVDHPEGGEEDDGEVVLDGDEEDEEDSQLDEEDEVTSTTERDTPLDDTDQQQQQQQQQSHIDAAEEASRALSKLQLQSTAATAHLAEAQSGAVLPPPNVHSGAVVPLGIPPNRTPSPQLLQPNGEERALTVIPSNELSATTTEAAMAANTFADMMGGHDVGWGDGMDGVGGVGTREGPPGLVVDGSGVVRRPG
eukprot:CAMPEP_0201884764 /NCGR_PEP_ID=MMETSP0902-20130614/17540_1 /ASSEMBLY_ACC=CAM_ASM_000551 /TAXON_ID=420261 /ORGANISM="Thalassiosira antarctica, Strain CCMP982" /LENGTH=337 /DNA_ID=CAMNT_0048413771 /DNA_START=145 /DNA_END=1155 /DNA_ORIENTATION=+